MEYFIGLIIFIYGLCFGSFANVCILRSLKDSSLWPRSCCPKCEHQLAWYDLVPVLSYIFLRGKCRYCKTSISIQYPIVELACAISWTVIYLYTGLSSQFFLYASFAFILLLITMTDLLEFVVDDRMVIAGILITLPIHFYQNTLIEALQGAVAGFAVSSFIYALGWLWSRIRGMQGFESGDITISVLIGFVLGWQKFLTVFMGGITIFAVFGIVMIILRKVDSKTPMPLVPAFTLAIILEGLLPYGLLGLFLQLTI